MEYKIKNQEPKALFQFFEEISAIPRGSGNEKELSEYLVSFAKARSLDYYHDEMYNVVIKKSGNGHNAQAPIVMLQGHQDMVCEKNSDSGHDFLKDGLDLLVENGYVKANGTTLGADNGIAVALMLAVLDDETLKHPPLECVFTVMEEVGLDGANYLDPKVLDARIMINLDSEEEGIATVSCSGGLCASLTKEGEFEREKRTHFLSVQIKGLLGGHSGIEIHLERANANKLMGRILHALVKETAVQLVKIEGGNKNNAIPRECFCTLAFENEAEQKKAEEIIKYSKSELMGELLEDEPSFVVEIEKPKESFDVFWTRKATEEIVTALVLAPDGAQKRNVKQGGFIVASTNLGVIKSDEYGITFTFAPRSSVASLQKALTDKILLLGECFGFTAEISGAYPGWAFASESKIREVFSKSYQKLFHKDLKMDAIHAGLECGLFAGKLPGLDAIAVGPTITGCHTPEERLDLESCSRTWLLLKEVLERIS